MKINSKDVADYLLGRIIIGYLSCLLLVVLFVIFGIIFLVNRILFFILVAILVAAYFGIQYRMKYHSERICRDAKITLDKFIDNYLIGFQLPAIPGSDIQALSKILSREGTNVPSTFILMTAVNKAVEQKRLTRFIAHLRDSCPSLPAKPGLTDIVDAYLKTFEDNIYAYSDLLEMYTRELGMEIKGKDLLKMIIKERDVRRVSRSILQN